MRTNAVLAVVLSSACSMACSTLLPAHPKSLDRTGEQVSIRLLTRDDINCAEPAGKPRCEPDRLEDTASLLEDYNEAYAATYGARAQGAVALAPIAIAIAGKAIDALKDALKDEAKQYEASFSLTVGVPAFYALTPGPSYSSRYDVLELTRETSKGRAYVFRAALFYSPGSKGFLLTPIQFQVNGAKAKVLNSTNTWRFLTRVPFIYGWFLKSEDRVDSTTSITFEGFAVRTEKVKEVTKVGTTETTVESERQMPIRPTLGTVEFKVSGYELSKNKLLRYKDKTIARNFYGWMLMPPVSDGGGDGAIAISATVYEKDTSNAAKYVNRLDESIDKEKILEALRKQMETDEDAEKED